MSSMLGWAGSSKGRAGKAKSWARVGCALLAAAVAPVAQARVYLSQEEALKVAFPSPARVERKTLFLDEKEAAAIEKEAGSKLPGRVFPYYVGRVEGKVTGYAYFDTHLVRTLPETLMVLLSPDGKIRRVEPLSFSEPEDYLPPEAWLGQFQGKGLDGELRVRRGIRNLTGASLTAGAITAACRRVLALHHQAVRGSD